MSVWKKIPVPPAGVMPGGLVTKIGIAATSLLLAAMLLTYTFTGGGEPDAEIAVPEAADLGLQQRAQAAIEAEARRQAAQLRLQADAAERQLAQLTGRTGIECSPIERRHRPVPGSRPRSGLASRRSAGPLRRPGPAHRGRGGVAGDTAARGNGAPAGLPSH